MDGNDSALEISQSTGTSSSSTTQLFELAMVKGKMRQSLRRAEDAPLKHAGQASLLFKSLEQMTCDAALLPIGYRPQQSTS
jgi:hypothetical protein